MSTRIPPRRSRSGFVFVFGCVLAASLTGCGGSKAPAATHASATRPPATTAPPPAPAAAAPPAATPATAQTWTPEALEDLLAPVALYPDPVLSQMLIAATNPQEVL